MSISGADLALALTGSLFSVVAELLRLSFYFRLRPGMRGSPLAQRVVDRIVSSIVWRTAMIVVGLMVIRLGSAVAGGEGVHAVWVVLAFSAYFGLVDSLLTRAFARWFDDSESEFRVSVRTLAKAAVRLDRNAWIDLEGELRKAVSARTKFLRERASGTLDDLLVQCAGDIERHVARSRRLSWLGYPAYRDGDWFRHMRAPNPRRLEVLVNAVGFPRFEALARAHPNWIDPARRTAARTNVSWPAVLHSSAGAVACEVVDISHAGLQARISGSTCADRAIVIDSDARIELDGAQVPLQVAWIRTSSFGGRFRARPATASP